MKPPKKLTLIGDVGGTKARFALLDPVKDELSEIAIFQCKEFPSFRELVKTYLEGLTPAKRPSLAIFAVAGPVIRGKANLTNLNWTIKASELEKDFSFERLYLINDLQALAASLFSLREGDIFALKKRRPLKRYPVVFMALGTGLGISLIVSRRPLLILPSEGGHTPFCSLDEEEEGFIRFLRWKQREITWEEALSGRGLSHWYEYFHHCLHSPEAITAKAKDGDPKAKRVVERIFHLLGRKCYELAVTFEPFGGIYLAGGVISALTSFWSDPVIRDSFFIGYNYSHKLRPLLEVIPLCIVLHPYPGLLGAQTIARSRLK